MIHEKLPDAFPLAWPVGWKRTTTRTRSRFKVTPGRARDEVIHELKRMGVPDWNIIISTNIPLRRDGLPYAGKESPIDPGVAVYFRKNNKPLVFACDAYTSVMDNLWAIAKTIDALRGIERWGASDMLERAFTGFAALPAPLVDKPWWEILGVASNASQEIVKARYRELVKVHHPDKGGDGQTWHKIQAAYEKGIARYS